MTQTLSKDWVNFRDHVAKFGITPIGFDNGVLSLRFDPKSAPIHEDQIEQIIIEALADINVENAFPNLGEYSVEIVGS